jgi:hypothetical protein
VLLLVDLPCHQLLSGNILPEGKLGAREASAVNTCLPAKELQWGGYM